MKFHVFLKGQNLDFKRRTPYCCSKTSFARLRARWMREREIHQKTIENYVEIHPKIYIKSIQIWYSKKWCQNAGKRCQNGAPWGPKMMKKTKNDMPKMRSKFGVAKKSKRIPNLKTRATQGSIFGQSGGKGGRLESIPDDFILNLTRSAPRRGAADPKGHKMDALGDLGLDFWDFGRLLKIQLFGRFFDREKVGRKSAKIRFWAAKVSFWELLGAGRHKGRGSWKVFRAL